MSFPMFHTLSSCLMLIIFVRFAIVFMRRHHCCQITTLPITCHVSFGCSFNRLKPCHLHSAFVRSFIFFFFASSILCRKWRGKNECIIPMHVQYCGVIAVCLVVLMVQQNKLSMAFCPHFSTWCKIAKVTRCINERHNINTSVFLRPIIIKPHSSITSNTKLIITSLLIAEVASKRDDSFKMIRVFQ